MKQGDNAQNAQQQQQQQPVKKKSFDLEDFELDLDLDDDEDDDAEKGSPPLSSLLSTCTELDSCYDILCDNEFYRVCVAIFFH